MTSLVYFFFFFFQAEDGIRDYKVTGVQTCALPILVLGELELVVAAVREVRQEARGELRDLGAHACVQLPPQVGEGPVELVVQPLARLARGDLALPVGALALTPLRLAHVVLGARGGARSEEHTSELQSPCNLVC